MTTDRRPYRPTARPPGRQKSTGSGEGAGLERALSKLGYCSRSQAHYLIVFGRVQVNGAVCRLPEAPVDMNHDQIMVDGKPVQAAEKVYLLLNKPRGLITTSCDEKGRDTVFSCFKDWRGERVFPVGRLDKSSEGLLFFTNDTRWSDHITAPESHLEKTYHVQIDCLPSSDLFEKLVSGVPDTEDEGRVLRALKASLLRQGEKNAWLEIVLDEGRNRHIRRLFEAFEIEVLRLVRVAIGPIPLGELSKGSYRPFTSEELAQIKKALQTTRLTKAAHQNREE